MSKPIKIVIQVLEGDEVSRVDTLIAVAGSIGSGWGCIFITSGADMRAILLSGISTVGTRICGDTTTLGEEISTEADAGRTLATILGGVGATTLAVLLGYPSGLRSS